MSTEALSQSARREALEAIEANEYTVSPDTSGQEDFDAYMDGDEPIHRWLVVTVHDDWYYLRTFEDYSVAQEHGAVNIDDDMFTELPVVIIDLDAPTIRFYPHIKVEWKQEFRS